MFLWDVATARTLRRWTGHFSRVNCVGFGGEDGSVVASGSFDATVRLWDCKSQSTKPIQVLEEARDSVSSLHVLGHEIVTGSVDGKMRVYDLRMGMIYVDTIGRMFFLAVKYYTADRRCSQILSHLSNRREMGTPSWFLRLTRPLDSWIKAMDSCCKVTEAIQTKTIGSDLVWVWRTPW